MPAPGGAAKPPNQPPERSQSAGLTMILGSIVHLVFAVKNHTADENTWTITIGAILGGLGLMFAADSTKSASEVKRVEDKVEQNTQAIITGNPDLAAKITTEPK